VIAAAADAFKALRGKQVADGAFSSSLQMTDAGACMIALRPDEALFACRRPFETEVDAQKAYEVELAHARSCLPDWPAKSTATVLSAQFASTQSMRLVGPSGVEVAVIWFQENKDLLKLEWVSVGIFQRLAPPVS
jgi:hypothetical protein